MTIRRRKTGLIVLFVVLAVGAGMLKVNHAMAATEDPYGKIYVDTGRVGSGSGAAATKGMPFVNRLIGFSAAVAAIALLVVIITNGIKVINNDKGPEALKEATTNILLSILGLGLAASAFIFTGYFSRVFYGDARFYTDPVAAISGSASIADWKQASSYVRFLDAIAALTGHDGFSGRVNVNQYVPDTNQVFGQPQAPASGLAAQSYMTGPQSLIASVVGLIAGFASVWLLLTIIWNGYKIITAGSPESLEKAVKTIGISLIGFLIAVMAYIITSYVTMKFFNNSITLDNPVQQLTPIGG